MSYRKVKNVRSGFTLIELLVVIAIISLLVSILIPSLTKAKDLAKNIICQTNLRGMGMAFTLYAEENGEKWPGRASGGISAYDESWVPSGWTDGCQVPKYNPDYDVAKGALFPYADNRGLYVCPSFDNPDFRKLNYAQYQELYGKNAQDDSAYWYRPRSQNNDDGFFRPFLTPQPETLVNLVERLTCFDANFVVRDDNFGIPGGERMNWIHNGTLNFLMVDGHVENYAQGDEDVLYDWEGKIWF